MSDMRLSLTVALAAAIALLAGSARAAITLEDPTNFQVKKTFSEKSIRKMIGFAHRLNSLRSRKTIPADTRAALLGAANPILADLQTLKGRL